MMTREERAEIRARYYRMGKATTGDTQRLLDHADEADRVITRLRHEQADECQACCAAEGGKMYEANKVIAQLRDALEETASVAATLVFLLDHHDIKYSTGIHEGFLGRAQSALAAGQGKEKP